MVNRLLVAVLMGYELVGGRGDMVSVDSCRLRKLLILSLVKAFG